MHKVCFRILNTSILLVIFLRNHFTQGKDLGKLYSYEYCVPNLRPTEDEIVIFIDHMIKLCGVNSFNKNKKAHT